jgi:hypothetical protein
MQLHFGRLTLAVPVRVENGRRLLLFKCACGKDAWVREDKIGKRKSCGCAVPPPRIRPRKRNRGRSATPRFIVPDELRITHSSWRSMIRRCHGTGSNEQFQWYRDAGVVVCERWRKSFSAFVADVGARPSLAYTLDRFPNKAGNYEPGNVRWATAKQQNNNRRDRRRTLLIAYQGELLSTLEIAQRTGLKECAVRSRIESGWDAERILTTSPRTWPGGRYGRSHAANGGT